MTPALASSPRLPATRPKHILFLLIAVMVAIVLYVDEGFWIQPHHPLWAHYREFRWWLFPHALAGSLALFLGPLQFSDRLRKKYLNWHRIAGRVYVGAVMAASPLGAYIQSLHGPTLFTAAASVQATLWVLTTGLAFYFVLHGNIKQHKQWMTRSFAVALVFIEVRILVWAVPALARRDVEGIMIAVWISVAFSLFLADVVLECEEFFRARPRKALAAAV